jgi:hypothetical protein
MHVCLLALCSAVTILASKMDLQLKVQQPETEVCHIPCGPSHRFCSATPNPLNIPSSSAHPLRPAISHASLRFTVQKKSPLTIQRPLTL